MKTKKLISAHRRRRVPEHFSWVDHRLVRDGHFRKCDNKALAFYLFLLIVGDADGLSYYGIRRLCEELNCDEEELECFRTELENSGLIAYKAPFYQVLDLDPATYGDECFSDVLRRSVKTGSVPENKNDEVDMHSPYWRRPENWKPVEKLGTIIKRMTGE